MNEHDEDFFRNMVRIADEYFQESVAYSETIGTGEMSADNFEMFISQARKINFLWMLGAEQFSEAAEEKLSDIVVAESFPADKVFAIIPKFITPLNVQHEEVMQLKNEIAGRTLAEVSMDASLRAKLDEHVKKFAWIEIANFDGNLLTIERLYEQTINAKEQEHTTPEPILPLPESLEFHAFCMSQCGYIRQAGAEYFFMLSAKIQPSLKRIAKKFNLSYAEFLLQRDSEILDALKGNLTALDLKANARRREKMDFVIFAGQGNDVHFSEEPGDIEILKQLMIPKADTDVSEIHGQVGNKGIYTGTARIIMNNRDFSKMQNGDVLVSTMTTPDFVVLMHTSGAIVTDIGGMLCHAAIVSREINRPCIIGTKIATQVLNDGDLVEVDADNGVVRVIKKAAK